MKHTPWLVALVAAAALLSGCSGSGSPLSPTSGPTAAAVPATGSSLSPADFAAAAKLPNTVIVDVRTPAEFTSGHLAGAINLDVESSSFTTQATDLDATKNYAIYCRAGNRSKTAITIMKQVGLPSVFDLAGGINAWKSAGGEVIS